MLSPSCQLRAFVSALLLLTQVLGLGHVALGRHVLSDSGALVDVAPLAAEAHDDFHEHLCAGDVTLHADAPEDCLVVASWSSPSLVTPSLVLRQTRGSSHPQLAALSFVAVQLDALSRAPKASPPQG